MVTTPIQPGAPVRAPGFIGQIVRPVKNVAEFISVPRDERPPYFPFYPYDFASDGVVEAMSTESVGAYILLLCKAWSEEPAGSIPNSDIVLARWARLKDTDWARCKPEVLAAFTLGTDDRWHQKRLRSEYQKLRKLQRTRATAGKAGAEARWQTHGKRIREPLARNEDEGEGIGERGSLSLIHI